MTCRRRTEGGGVERLTSPVATLEETNILWLRCVGILIGLSKRVNVRAYDVTAAHLTLILRVFFVCFFLNIRRPGPKANRPAASPLSAADGLWQATCGRSSVPCPSLDDRRDSLITGDTISLFLIVFHGLLLLDMLMLTLYPAAPFQANRLTVTVYTARCVMSCSVASRQVVELPGWVTNEARLELSNVTESLRLMSREVSRTRDRAPR